MHRVDKQGRSFFLSGMAVFAECVACKRVNR